MASELRRLRTLALLTAEQVASELGWSASKLSRIENAKIRIKDEDARHLLRLYNVDDQQAQDLLGLLEDDGQKGWWEAYADILPHELSALIGFEDEAAAGRTFEPMVVPGLLQTEAYARRTLGMWESIHHFPPVEIERRLQVRMLRQRILVDDDPLDFSVVIDEAVLTRQVTDRPAMREQLYHLVKMSLLPNVQLQILPLAGPHVISVEPFIILNIPNFRDVVCVENEVGSRMYIDDSTQTYTHTLIFNELQRAALDVDQSRSIIKSLADNFWSP